ncbi:hypothetical protein [Streptomyces nigrescens]
MSRARAEPTADARAFPRPHTATLTTLRPDGTPHVTPVRFSFDPASGLARVTPGPGPRSARRTASAGSPSRGRPWSAPPPHAEDDRTVARFVGRPVALIRAGLGFDLKGPPLTDSSWEHVLFPPEEDYPTYDWPIRLGDADRLSDGLIGYYATAGEPGDEISYDRLHAVDPLDDSGYTIPIGKDEGLAMPARTTCQEPLTHHLLLLADPHVPVHATTGILTIASLALPADLIHQSLLRIRASFRLNPLLAPVRQAAAQEEDEPLPPGLVMPQPASWHGTWTWAEPFRPGSEDDVPE